MNKEPRIVEKERLCPEEKFLRTLFGIGNGKLIVEPVDEIQIRCVCGKYKYKKYQGLICDRCRKVVKERLIRRLPEGWRLTKEYKDWLKLRKEAK